MKKQERQERLNKVLTVEGKKFSKKVTDKVVKVYGKTGGFITRLLEDGDGDLQLDIRRFYEDNDGNWAPTGKGIRIKLETSRQLLRTLRQLKKDLEEQQLWDEYLP